MTRLCLCPNSTPSGSGVRAGSFCPGAFFPFFTRRGQTKQGKINMKLQNVIHILIGILCIALLPQAQAVIPPPDGGYPRFNTAEGQNALSASPTALRTQPLVGIRSLATQRAASTPLPVRGHSFSRLTTTTRRLAQRRFYSTPPASIIQPLERPPY